MRDYPKLQILTVEGLLNGTECLNAPPQENPLPKLAASHQRTSSLRCFEHYAVVSLLEDIIAQGAQVRTQLRELFEQDEAYPGDLKSMWLIGSVDLALEHHEAIWRLQEQKLTGAAFALLRPLIETMLRALWLNKRVTSEEQVKRAWRDKKVFPKMGGGSKL